MNIKYFQDTDTLYVEFRMQFGSSGSGLTFQHHKHPPMFKTVQQFGVRSHNPARADP